jgi:IS5 family transposase
LRLILHILIGFYFKKSPPFDFRFQFEAQERQVTLEGEDRRLSVRVDGESKSVDYFAERLRGGPAQVYYPELTFVYYSGECQRIRRLIKRYERDFQQLTRKPETDNYRPLFVESSNEQSDVILLALFAHRQMSLLNHLGLRDVVNLSLELRSPQTFDPARHEPKLWNTEGAVRRIVAAIDETAISQESRRLNKARSESSPEEVMYSETRTYWFRDGSQADGSIRHLADRLARSNDNLYFEQEIPDHSTFSKNRHGRFRESGVFRKVFEEIVRRCLQAGLVEGKNLAVDGTMIEANASPQSRVAREKLKDVVRLPGTVREYLSELEKANPVSDAKMASTTDPDAVWAKKVGPAKMAYFDYYLIDTRSRVILGVEATPALFHQETVAARKMVEQVQKFGLKPETLGADKAYGSGEFLAWLLDRGVQPHIPVIDRRHQTKGRFTRDQFRHEPAENAYYCPEGKVLSFRGRRCESQGYLYRSTEAQCGSCPQKKRCTSGPYRRLFVHEQESVRQAVRALAGTPAYECSRRARYKIEALFAELKQRMRLGRVRLRRLWNVSEQFLLAATAQNLKRLVRFFARRPPLLQTQVG